MATIEIVIVPCRTDNYAYLVRSGDAVGVVDPSDEAPVADALDARSWTLTHVLNTHHHGDHTGGNLGLKARYGDVLILGPMADMERIPGIDVALAAGETVAFGETDVTVLDIPGHTKGHIAFWFTRAGEVFTGDTLFAMGCGRLFEGTPRQMLTSLTQLGRLPGPTRVWCGHEYTESNGRFALTLEPGNEALQRRMDEVQARRAAGEPTIPSTIDIERRTNPFLRWHSREIRQGLGMVDAPDVAVLAEMRRRKDHFRG